jgi:hypothetical protein
LGSDGSWNTVSFLPLKEKRDWEGEAAYEDNPEHVPEATEAFEDEVEPVSIPEAIEEQAEPVPEAIEREAKPIAQTIEDDDWGSWEPKRRKKGKRANFEEEVEPVAQAGDEFGWSDWSNLAAATKKAKERGMEEPEEAEPVAQAKNEFGWSGWSNLATPAKKAKKGKIEKPEEPELTSPDQFRTGNIVVVPSLDPDVERSNACPFRAQHILDGKVGRVARSVVL